MDYSKISSQFWLGRTGKKFRGDVEAQVVALYLLTSPHASMIGIFYCPILYISHETGLTMEGASEGLGRAIEGGFCAYDTPSETVWVHEMARFQIGDSLKPGDKRIVSIQNHWDNLPEGPIKQGFYEKYGSAFSIVSSKPLPSPSDAPSKPLPSPSDAPTKPIAIAIAVTTKTLAISPKVDIACPNASVSDPESDVQQSESIKKFPGCPHQEIIALWQKHLPRLTQPRVWEGNRREILKARWAQASKPSAFNETGYSTLQDGLAWWGSFFAYIAETRLADGFDTDGRIWRPDLEWVIRPANFQKIIDGKYQK